MALLAWRPAIAYPGPTAERLEVAPDVLGPLRRPCAVANLLANVLFVVDDFSPDATAADARRRADAADRLLRGTANQGGRPRLRPDGTLRPDRVPRAQILTSAEDVPPPVESLIARAMIVEVIRGAVDIGVLSTAQTRAAEGAYAVAVGGYIRRIAGRWDRQPDLSAHLSAVRHDRRAPDPR